MARWAALLRGINVGSHKRMAMADLRRLVEALGHDDVETLLQSGNVVFSSTRRDGGALAAEISGAIADELDMDVKVLVRSGPELAAVAAGNPFPEAVGDPKKLHVAFLAGPLDPTKVQGIDPSAVAPGRFAVGDGVLYVLHDEGMQGSLLTKHLTEKRLGVTMTARNWSTVTKLVEATA